MQLKDRYRCREYYNFYISLDSVINLNLEVGKEALAIIKSTLVMIGIE